MGAASLTVARHRETFYWLFFTPLWIFPLCLAIFGMYSPLALMFYYQLVFRLPHFFMTYVILQSRNFFRRNNFFKILRYFGPPLLIILLVLGAGYFDQRIPRYFILGTFILGFYHNSAQAMGLSLMFLAFKDQSIVRAVKAAFLCLYFISLEPMIVFAFRVDGFFPSWLLLSLKIIFSVLVSYVIIRVYRKEKNFKFFFYFISSIAVLFPWSFYQNYLQQFFVHNFHHSINYLGIVIAGIAKSEINVFKDFKPTKIYLICLGLSVSIGLFFQPELMRLKNTFGFINCFFFIHYYVESIMWKDPELDLKKIPLFEVWKSKFRLSSDGL